MTQEQLRSECVEAFEKGNKQDAKRLLPQIEQPADIRTNNSIENTSPVSLLHLAVKNGWMDIIIDLIIKYKCDTNCRNSDGLTPLHYAVINNHLEVVKYFINEEHCDPMTRDYFGNSPLHYVCRYADPVPFTISEVPAYKNDNGDIPLHFARSLNIAKFLISEAHCNPSCENKKGNTPLHFACSQGYLDITKFLISEAHCNPSCENKRGNTPLHLACSTGHYKIVQLFICEVNCNPSSKNKYGHTPLHLACSKGHYKIAKYLISEAHCNPSCENNNGDTPLHFACSNGHLNIAKYLISEANCNPSCENRYGDTPFRVACSKGHLISIGQYLICEAHCKTDNCEYASKLLFYACKSGKLYTTQCLISEAQCDPSRKDSDGNTPLHYASLYGQAHIVQYLLSTGKVNPLAKNKNGNTPIDWASRKPNNYNVLKLFQLFPQCKRDFPVHTYTKLILTGYSGVGKTTISQLTFLLANKASGFLSWLSSRRVTDVECLTAGIIPLHVESKVNELSNMVIYDFAGQKEYYSSHGAVLERIMRNSAAIFICIVDLSQCMDKISESIHYWISFIENACSSAQGSSHVIIVGSHADLVKSSRELKEKSSLVESIAERRVKQLTYGGFVSMDCRLSNTKEAHHFRSLLSTSQQAILSSLPSMSLYCHVLYAFLHSKLRKNSCTLQELTSALDSENDRSYKSTLLTKSLISLSDKGLILFLQKSEDLQASWVVVEKEVLLREVNGTLFAPVHFKQYRQVASNTGIVPIATLEELFPQYSSEMLVGCLESMEFCNQVDLSTLQATNLKATSSSPSGANHLFFPSLIKEHRPSDLPSPRFGWCLGCSDPHQFFSNRFLHVLLLRLAYRFSLASKNRSLSPSLCGLERQCEVWQNGICWKSVSGVSTIVEIIDLNRWVIVLVSEKTREAAQTCSSVIKMIFDIQHQLCSPLVTTCECLISPSLLDRYPFDALPDNDLFDLPTVARSMLLHHKLLLDRKEGKNEFSTDEALSCEPYYLLQPSSVCQLFNQSMASQPVPDPLLQEVLSYCQLQHQKPQDHNELRECVNKHSIFAGRNPLVSCSVQAVL